MNVTPDFGALPLVREAGPTKEMLSVGRTEDGRTHVRINSSSLSVLLTCMRKSELSLFRGLRSKVESPATLYGSAIHKALETFYSAPREEREIPPNFDRNADLLLSGEGPQDALVYRCIQAFLTKAEPLRMLPEDDKRSLSAGIWTLTHYFRTYIDDPFVVLTDAAGPITERTCSAVLYDGPMRITLFGTIDVILKNERTGVVLPCDHKTSSVVGTEFYSRLKPNHQYTGYVYLAQQDLGIEADSFLVNCIQVKARAKTARGTPPNFPRQVTRRTPEDVEEFRGAVVWAVERYLAACIDGRWPQADVNACSMYRGCSFIEVCGSPKALRENILEANFLGKS